MAWEHERRRLMAMRKDTEAKLERTGQYGLDDSMQDELGELSMYDNHPADIGDALFEREKDLTLRDNDKIRMQDIDRALKAIHDGTYGTCTECGKPIPRERLEAQPTALLCVHCKDVDEDRHPDRERPVEEEFLWPGFARTNMDHEDYVAFDGEDSWQAVARSNEQSGYELEYEQIEMDDNEGIVDDMDRFSNEDYKAGLP